MRLIVFEDTGTVENYDNFTVIDLGNPPSCFAPDSDALYQMVKDYWKHGEPMPIILRMVIAQHDGEVIFPNEGSIKIKEENEI